MIDNCSSRFVMIDIVVSLFLHFLINVKVAVATVAP